MNRHCLGGTEEASGIGSVCQLLEFQDFFSPPPVLELPHPALVTNLSSGVSLSFSLPIDVILPGTKGFHFICDELLFFCIILIKPILMFSVVVPKGVLAGVENY